MNILYQVLSQKKGLFPKSFVIPSIYWYGFIFVCIGSFVLGSPNKNSWPWPVEFCSEDLFGNDGLLDASSEGTEVLVLVSILLPVDSSQAEVHDLVIEAQSLSNLHSYYYYQYVNTVEVLFISWKASFIKGTNKKLAEIWIDWLDRFMFHF